jgi:hypothetical protein
MQFVAKSEIGFREKSIAKQEATIIKYDQVQNDRPELHRRIIGA